MNDTFSIGIVWPDGPNWPDQPEEGDIVFEDGVNYWVNPDGTRRELKMVIGWSEAEEAA